MNTLLYSVVPVIIFSIDDQSVYGLMKFYRAVADKQAMMKLKGGVIPCVGMYEGVMEFSWIATEEDFKNHFTEFAINQNSVFRVVTDGSGIMLGTLYNNKTGDVIQKGRLRDVDPETALRHNSFTYRPDLDKYWVMM